MRCPEGRSRPQRQLASCSSKFWKACLARFLSTLEGWHLFCEVVNSAKDNIMSIPVVEAKAQPSGVPARRKGKVGHPTPPALLTRGLGFLQGVTQGPSSGSLPQPGAVLNARFPSSPRHVFFLIPCPWGNCSVGQLTKRWIVSDKGLSLKLWVKRYSAWEIFAHFIKTAKKTHVSLCSGVCALISSQERDICRYPVIPLFKTPLLRLRSKAKANQKKKKGILLPWHSS